MGRFGRLELPANGGRKRRRRRREGGFEEQRRIHRDFVNCLLGVQIQRIWMSMSLFMPFELLDNKNKQNTFVCCIYRHSFKLISNPKRTIPLIFYHLSIHYVSVSDD